MDNSIFVPVKPTRTIGWQVTDTEPSDDVIVAFAKRGYLLEYWSTEDNDYDGAFCRVTDMKGKQRDYEAGEWIVFDGNHKHSLLNNDLRWCRDYDGGEDTVTTTTLKDALDEAAALT